MPWELHVAYALGPLLLLQTSNVSRTCGPLLLLQTSNVSSTCKCGMVLSLHLTFQVLHAQCQGLLCALPQRLCHDPSRSCFDPCSCSSPRLWIAADAGWYLQRIVNMTTHNALFTHTFHTLTQHDSLFQQWRHSSEASTTQLCCITSDHDH